MATTSKGRLADYAQHFTQAASVGNHGRDHDPQGRGQARTLAAASCSASPVIIALDVDNADAVAEAMLAAGATVVFPIQDADYGERSGRLADPFGHLWMISQRLEDLSPEEIQRRTDQMFAG